ncbi:hypothetical protein FOZ63_020083, partial [Perkinsus olseni]
LRNEDLTFNESDRSLHIHIRQSKTDQSGTGETVVVGCVNGLESSTSCASPFCIYHRLWVKKQQEEESSSDTSKLFETSYTQLSKDIKFLVEAVMAGSEVGQEELAYLWRQSLSMAVGVIPVPWRITICEITLGEKHIRALDICELLYLKSLAFVEFVNEDETEG